MPLKPKTTRPCPIFNWTLLSYTSPSADVVKDAEKAAVLVLVY